MEFLFSIFSVIILNTYILSAPACRRLSGGFRPQTACALGVQQPDPEGGFGSGSLPRSRSGSGSAAQDAGGGSCAGSQHAPGEVRGPLQMPDLHQQHQANPVSLDIRSQRR